MSDAFTILVKRFDPQDPRLGRHVVHDSRSLRYRAPAGDLGALASVRHKIEIPIMDQGNVGSCTGHAGTAAIAYEAFWDYSADAIGPGDPHVYAEHLYSDATKVDPWPGAWLPDDTGSDGLSIAKVLQARGLISGYQHATSLEAALTALAQRPVMIGSNWLEGMYTTGPDGQMTVSGQIVGGHEYVLDELDVERQRVWMRNSWGMGYGISGRGWMGWEDLRGLLAADGDCTVLVPRAEPAPQPQPIPAPTPAPAPAPTPSPTPTPAPDDPAAPLRVALAKFLRTSACPKYVKKAAQAWLGTASPSTSKRRTR
jgi:hypothetical protein